MLNLFLYVLAVTLSPGVASLFQSAPPAASVVPAGFTLAITAETNPLKAGSDLRVAVYLTNTSKQKFTSGRWVGGPDESFIVEMYDNQGKEAPFSKRYSDLRAGRDSLVGSVYMYSIMPGDTMTERVLVNLKYDLSTPGTYTLQIRRRDVISKADVKSNKITVTIVN